VQPRDWPAEIHRELAAAGVATVGYVPDAGHKRLIELCQADKKMRAVVLTTEEEGIGLAAGAWLGGEKSVLLMQSSGVGNVINAIGQATRAVLEAMGTIVHAADSAEDIAPTVNAALRLAYNSYVSVAVLISQRVIGIKTFQEQSEK
jgi:sulfopyruvate decarboxylase TPP-binding subunit